jgi:hypothetical protein
VELLLVGLNMEVAEATPRDADIGDIYIAVNLPSNHLGILYHLATPPVGQGAKLPQGGFEVEFERLFAA